MAQVHSQLPASTSFTLLYNCPSLCYNEAYMGETPQGSKAKTTTQAVLLLGTSALDTTWRVLVPGIVGTILGLILDHTWHTTPFVMIAGLVLGIALSVVLVIKQLKALSK